MHLGFEFTTALQYKVKALERKAADFESGERYRRIETDHKKQLRAKDREIVCLTKELAEARHETVTVRNNWFETFEDVMQEHDAQLAKKDRRINTLENRVLEAERQRDCAKDKLRDMRLELYEVKTELEEEQEKNKKLMIQVNRDFENSSLPSSMKIERKKIPNSREATGRKPGGQAGHEGRRRKRQAPTERHEIPALDKYAKSADYEATGKTISRQKIKMNLSLEVIEYSTQEYRHVKTGRLVHADFPEGYANDVNYDGSVKAMAFLLGNECNVSLDKIRMFLSEMTGGQLELSKGMINGLCKEFSTKTVPEQKEACATLLSSPVMNVDFTGANVNGESAQVLICAAPQTAAALFVAREHKGHEGVKGTLVENYQGALVHDHDMTFYSYGTNHQECMQHNCRYLKGSIQNESGLSWNTKMQELVREMLHWRNGLEENDELDEEIVTGFKERYDEILEIARLEYEYEPPGKYYRDGYNLFKRLKEYKKNELLFLHDKRIPANNSLCERLARVYKRKQKQAIVMRSFESLGYLCNSLSTIHTLRLNGKNTFQHVAQIFDRPRPRKT